MSIESHEFADSIAEIKAHLCEAGTIIIEHGGSWIFLDRDDVIELAKVYKLKEKDLII